MSDVTSHTTSSTESPQELEHDVESTRAQLGNILRELKRRKNDALDWRLQASRHAGALTVAGASVLAVTGGATALAIWSARRRRRPGVRARAIRDALARAFAHPDRVARPRPGIMRRLLSAASLEMIMWSAHLAIAHIDEKLHEPRRTT